MRPITRATHVGLAALAGAFALLALAASPARSAGAPHHWVGAWSAAMIPLPSPANPVGGARSAPEVANQTLREILRVGASGPQLRIVLDNRYGTVPVSIDAASIGRREIGASLVEGSLRPVHFSGQTHVVLGAGKQLVSDPIDMPVHAGDMLGVNLYIKGKASAQTWHGDPRDEQYIAAGDRTDDIAMADADGLPGIAWLDRVDVRTEAPAEAVVTLGDSITNGYRASARVAWPQVLQDRLDATQCHRPVLNAGIDGNQVAAAVGTFGAGEAMYVRAAHDVLAVPGVRYMVLLGGINDIGLSTVAAHAEHQGTPSADALADPVIAAQKKILAAAHARGLKVIGATVLPFDRTTRTYTASGEAARQKLNAWIRGPAGFDGVIDFDRALRDPAHPKQLQARYDSGDNLHPSDAGYQAMGRAIPLDLFGCH